MLMLRMLAAAGLSIAAGSLAPASAQGFAPACEREVKDLCGRISVGRCFQDESLWNSVSPRCTGDIQTMIEMEREALEQQAEDNQSRRQAADADGGIQRGRSYGGILRAGPGMEFSKLGSLQPDDDINLL